jgi:uroporphyrinogen-III synthase
MRVAVLRPAPDNARTAARLTKLGHDVTLLPLFKTRALPWTVPEPDVFEAILFTSANAVRLGGAGLDRLKSLPVIAVGRRTAAAAHAAGFVVAITGDADAAGIAEAAKAAGYRNLLHLAGRDHVAIPDATATTVYASEELAVPKGAIRGLEGHIVLLHSRRAAARFATLAKQDQADPARIAIAALSPAVLAAAGNGWRWTMASTVPDDESLVALVHARAIDPDAIDRREAAADKAP